MDTLLSFLGSPSSHYSCCCSLSLFLTFLGFPLSYNSCCSSLLYKPKSIAAITRLLLNCPGLFSSPSVAIMPSLLFETPTSFSELLSCYNPFPCCYGGLELPVTTVVHGQLEAPRVPPDNSSREDGWELELLLGGPPMAVSMARDPQTKAFGKF
ncbi:hypothetical protein CRG98_017585 [Punica granatum]|uniref:Uncharacterized protein n=1 Tax=Punica granatum TaxID=22663 RepID=A0A2I0K1R6_PUNGR|nr:hypothetical protein CRG98_017585 [Punica granatum]